MFTVDCIEKTKIKKIEAKQFLTILNYVKLNGKIGRRPNQTAYSVTPKFLKRINDF